MKKCEKMKKVLDKEMLAKGPTPFRPVKKVKSKAKG